MAERSFQVAKGFSWRQPRGRKGQWRYRDSNGKDHYLRAPCKGPDDIDGYMMAQQEGMAIQETIDSGVNESDVNNLLEHADETRGNPSTVLRQALDYRSNKPEDMEASTSNSRASKLNTAVARYLEFKRAEGEAFGHSLSSYAEYVTHIQHFATIARDEKITSLVQVDVAFLDKYKLALLAAKTKGRLCRKTVQKKLSLVKKFLIWCSTREYITRLPNNVVTLSELPRENNHTGKTVDDAAPPSFTREEVRRLFAYASPRLKTFILLGLNVGFTSVDISTLTADMIDFENGTLSRLRNKTGCPQCAKLWPETIAALKEHMNYKPGALLFQTREGYPLVHSHVAKSGNVTHVDSTQAAFALLKKEAGLPKDQRGFRVFRKSAANIIEQNNQDKPHISSLFLAHSEKKMKKHYVSRFFELLGPETDKVREYYGLTLEMTPKDVA